MPNTTTVMLEPGRYLYTRLGWSEAVPVTIEKDSLGNLVVRIRVDGPPTPLRRMPADAEFKAVEAGNQ